ncbi:MAG: N-succinylarginine dihydrolase, partial [Chlamydiia bacterium]|nr:N-succinylarginine dihydrolase [Chlamydiia bacterium]
MVSVRAVELQIDGLPGPTHNFAGLALGDRAAMENKGKPSNPRAAFRQALDKAKFVSDLGMPQAVFPPHERPLLRELWSRGIYGSPQHMLWQAKLRSPELFYSVFSSSGVWMANSATVTPKWDSVDGVLPITPASMNTFLHRSLEAPFVYRIFQKIFKDVAVVHEPLSRWDARLGDEGAANHMRFSLPIFEDDMGGFNLRGLNLFIYGRRVDTPKEQLPSFPARQTREASVAIIEQHKIIPKQYLLEPILAPAIDAGVFHNDVISTNCKNFWMFHEGAYPAYEGFIQTMQNLFIRVGGILRVVVAKEKELP